MNLIPARTLKGLTRLRQLLVGKSFRQLPPHVARPEVLTARFRRVSDCGSAAFIDIVVGIGGKRKLTLDEFIECDGRVDASEAIRAIIAGEDMEFDIMSEDLLPHEVRAVPAAILGKLAEWKASGKFRPYHAAGWRMNPELEAGLSGFITTLESNREWRVFSIDATVEDGWMEIDFGEDGGTLRYNCGDADPVFAHVVYSAIARHSGRL